jgi:shikimate kinase
MKIFILGYMGCGKSGTGKKLAARIGYDFIDLDDLIEEQYNKTIPEIFESEGENKFRELEHNYLKGLMEKDNVVISLGGGTPCFYNNMELMNSNGVTIYLKMSAEMLASRLKDSKKARPLLKDKSAEELKDFITESLEKREPFYLNAMYKVKAKDLDIEELAVFVKEKTSPA